MGSYGDYDDLTAPHVIDIRSGVSELLSSEEIERSLKAEPPSFPSLLLWNEQGLQYFERVTYAKEYYLTNCEIELLKQHSHKIASRIEPGSVIVELGSGSLRKIMILLQALEDLRKPVDYYALDLSRSELERTLQAVNPGTFQCVRCHGLLGDYDAGLEWLQRFQNASRPRVVLSLGSTLGSFTRREAAEFLGKFANALNHCVDGAVNSEPLMVIGLDGCKDGEKVWHAYNDTEDKNDEFIRNALDYAGRFLDNGVFQQHDWDRRGEWNEELGRHEQYLIPKKDIWFEGRCLKAGEKIFLVASHKYDSAERQNLWAGAGLFELKGWQTNEHQHGNFPFTYGIKSGLTVCRTLSVIYETSELIGP